jgi:hypothetical protein
VLAPGVTIMATGLAATGLARSAGLAAGLPTATGDGLARAAGDGLALGAGLASIAVGVAACGEPTAVGGLDTFAVDKDESAPLPQAATSTLNAADSNNR